MWISVGIAVTRIGAILAKNVALRKSFQVGTVMFVLLSVEQSRRLRKQRDEIYKLSREGISQNEPMVQNQSNDVPF